MSRETADAFVRNLKLLNAKERDHLMRLAYLGQGEPYAGSSKFLSPEMDELLLEHVHEMGLTDRAKCVFAGMDYHLDWLFAALYIAKTDPDWCPSAPPPPGALEEHGGVEGTDDEYTDFRSVNGSQEDLDLLVVYREGDKLAVLFIEAKGSAAFARVQLARKLIRLDRILVNSKVWSKESSAFAFRLILMAPEWPSSRRRPIKCCLEYAKDLPPPKPGEEDEYRFMRAALNDHRTGIGRGLHFLPLTGFPQKELYAVERQRSGKGKFTHWNLKERR